ncbi:MAG: hypothetical protein RL238_2473 [Actinomycetota bacterium]
MRRRVAVLLAMVLMPLAVAAARTAEAAPPPEAFLVGDSVINGMAQTYGATSRALLAARHTFIMDTKGCRRLITTSCRIGDNPAPPNAITTIRANAGRYRTALVVGVGYNDPTTGSVGLTTAIDVILAEAKRQGIPYVIWLTYRVAGPSASRFAAHNSVLRTKAARDPRLIIADWATRSASMPTSWFSADGIHLGRDATIAMADLIADTLDKVTAPMNGSKCVVTNSTTPAPTFPVPVTKVTALAGGATGSAAARRQHLWCP